MALTQGISLNCGARSGGVKNLWLGNREDIATAGFTLSGEQYSAVTMEATKVFYKFEFDQDSAEHRHNGSRENKSGLVNHEIEFFLGKLSEETRFAMQQIMDTSNCGLIAIVEDNNNEFWVYGYSENHKSKSDNPGRPLELLSGNGASGKVFTDATGATVILTAANNQYPRTWSAGEGGIPV